MSSHEPRLQQSRVTAFYQSIMRGHNAFGTCVSHCCAQLARELSAHDRAVTLHSTPCSKQPNKPTHAETIPPHRDALVVCFICLRHVLNLRLKSAPAMVQRILRRAVPAQVQGCRRRKQTVCRTPSTSWSTLLRPNSRTRTQNLNALIERICN